MMRISRIFLTAIAFCALFARTECPADLFALGSSRAEIHRIDSTTGTLIKTYSILPGFSAPTIRSGLAFDGRTLYVTLGTPVSPIVEIARFDVVDEVWLPPTIVDTPLSFPPDGFGGLGFRRENGRSSLFGVVLNQSFPDDPLEVYEYEVFDSFPFPFPIASHQFFPPNGGSQYWGIGLDVDPDTGEIWMATREFITPPALQSLVQIDLNGNVLATLPLELEPPSRPIRGVGFDNGQLFVADVLRNIHEIDRTDGHIIRSFTLPVEGLIGALTGGDVVPEPTAAWLLVLGVIVGPRRRRRCQR